MSTRAVNCSIELRGFDANSVDETREVFIKIKYKCKNISCNITNDILEATGASGLHSGFPNVVDSTPLNTVLIDIHPKTKEFRNINGGSKTNWISQVCDKSGGYLYYTK